MSLFHSFKLNKELSLQTPFIDVYSVMHDGEEYTIILTRMKANKRTIIQFVDNTVYWKQLPRFPRLTGMVHGEGNEITICKFNSENNKNTLLVVRGNPLGDEGLDNGIFRSPKKYDKNYVNVMTCEKFKSL